MYLYSFDIICGHFRNTLRVQYEHPSTKTRRFFMFCFVWGCATEFSKYTTAELVAEVKQLQNLAYQLGLEEAKEMTRGKYLNILSRKRRMWQRKAEQNEKKEKKRKETNIHTGDVRIVLCVMYICISKIQDIESCRGRPASSSSSSSSTSTSTSSWRTSQDGPLDDGRVSAAGRQDAGVVVKERHVGHVAAVPHVRMA